MSISEKIQLEQLLRRYLNDQLSEEECVQMHRLLQEPGAREVLAGISVEDISLAKDVIADISWDVIWQNVMQDISSSGTTDRVHGGVRSPVLPLRKWAWAAAGILLALGIGFYIWISNGIDAVPAAGMVNTGNIAPGKDGAVLILADGSRMVLDSIKNGVVALQGGAIAKVVNGSLLYETNGEEVVYNTVFIPRGRRFQVTLSDGTEVWLNSASSIRYPTVFAGNERRVEISGEAYFKVAQNREMPFRVNVNDKAEVTVLGTQFNVNAYENEKRISTTLIEGSVAIALPSDRQPEGDRSGRKTLSGSRIILKPGQQALLNTGQQALPRTAQQAQSGIIEVVNNADIEKAIAWKNDLFNFDNIEFEVAMRQLERWYDIEVVYEKGIPANIELFGKITKDVTLNDLLIGLAKIGVKCRLEGRRLLIRP